MSCVFVRKCSISCASVRNRVSHCFSFKGRNVKLVTGPQRIIGRATFDRQARQAGRCHMGFYFKNQDK